MPDNVKKMKNNNLFELSRILFRLDVILQGNWQVHDGPNISNSRKTGNKHFFTRFLKPFKGIVLRFGACESYNVVHRPIIRCSILNSTFSVEIRWHSPWILGISNSAKFRVTVWLQKAIILLSQNYSLWLLKYMWLIRKTEMCLMNRVGTYERNADEKFSKATFPWSWDWKTRIFQIK